MQTLVDATVSATVTMRALSTLLVNIPTIPIYDHVADKVYAAADKCTDVRRRLVDDSANTQSLIDALQSALSAQSLADLAYTDASLVSMLYFPDDQKHAIYIPLFLPVCLPVAFALLNLIKYALAVWRERRSNKTKVE